MAEKHLVEVRDDSIRLGQLLKLAGAVDQGSDVKELLASGLVAVNDQPESRRGRRLGPGDEVRVGETSYVVTRSG